MFNINKFFPSEIQRYDRLKKNDPTIVFMEEALKKGDFDTFDKTAAAYIENNKSARKDCLLVFKQISIFAPQCIRILVEKGEMQKTAGLIGIFKKVGADLTKINETVLELHPKIEDTIKGLLSQIIPTPKVWMFADKEDSSRDIVAVLYIQKAFSIPDSFFEEPEIFELACEKVAEEIDRYFFYKDMDMIAIFAGAEKVPNIPEKILHSPRVQKAIEERLTRYLQESDINKAKNFASIFNYKKLDGLIIQR